MNPKANVMDLFRLDGQKALVIGGAGGLGFYIALGLAEAGADVAVTSRHADRATAAAKVLSEATSCKTSAFSLDSTEESQIETVMDETIDRHGRIDILVNNAGNTRNSAPFENRRKEDWEYTLSVNLTGYFLCAKHAVRKSMMKVGGGRIINMGSTAGMIGKDRRVYENTDMGGVTVDYAAAKGGVIALTKDLAAYLAPYKIRVNCVSPAGFWRNQPEPFVEAYSKTIMLGRMGNEEKEIKGAVVFLASEAASYITGHNLVVDGGLTAW